VSLHGEASIEAQQGQSGCREFLGRLLKWAAVKVFESVKDKIAKEIADAYLRHVPKV
jgi:hypothetical protein